MSDAADPGTGPAPAFSARAVLALVGVGIVAFAALAVLSAYAPDLRTGEDGRAHALSRSAVGLAGAPILMKALGDTVVVSRTRPQRLGNVAVVLTPEAGDLPKALAPFAGAAHTLIVLPKWIAVPDPIRRGFVRKLDVAPAGAAFSPLLIGYSRATRTAVRKAAGRPVLRGAGGPFAAATYLPLGRIDRLQTVSGDGWAPALTDETGGIVLAYSRRRPDVWLLADPDLLNNQGLSDLNTARAGVAVLQAASAGGAHTLLFDVTLAGFERGRGLGRLMLEPPWLAATLCAVAAALLMGVHALARFGQPRRRGRAFALGARALVDNSADLVRMARKEHELAPAYAVLIRGLVERAAGGHVQAGWLEGLAARRGVAAPGQLEAEAGRVKTRDDLLAIAKRLYDWRGEMTRERR
ncbi:hypothetical protein [Phenylobacterium sp.]|uniref:hypothetical protein n=1 Tax=Phenylobacterium sp. TaxID=1871053 RepID=UPI0025D912AF|nr:hypothetical protein [Phenylobacterium sp.]